MIQKPHKVIYRVNYKYTYRVISCFLQHHSIKTRKTKVNKNKYFKEMFKCFLNHISQYSKGWPRMPSFQIKWIIFILWSCLIEGMLFFYQIYFDLTTTLFSYASLWNNMSLSVFVYIGSEIRFSLVFNMSLKEAFRRSMQIERGPLVFYRVNFEHL